MKNASTSKTDLAKQKQEQENAFIKELLKDTDLGKDDKMSLSYHLKQMDEKSIDAMANELREGYMQLKDLSSRCFIDMENIQKNDKRVFYFKPNSIFLESPEKQRQFRKRFLNRVKNVKEPISNFGLAD